MHCTRKVTEDIIWIGASDRRLALFENAYPVPRGISYNSYLLLDEQTVLFDTADKAVADRFLENLLYALGGRNLDYLVIDHMEPDHCHALAELVSRWPDMKLVVNSRTLPLIKQFFDFDIESRAIVVREGDKLNTGHHTLSFWFAPMVHWPEVMVTYDSADMVLFSADAFGTFGALCGNIFADEVNFALDWLDGARRYYTNIVGKYGAQTTVLLNKISQLDVRMLCPLHGPIWRKNLPWYIDKYRKWAAWEPEEKGVLIAFGSIYGHTENAADILAAALADRGVRNIAMYDVSAVHPSYIVADAFRFSHLVLASSTYNNGIFSNMETLLLDLKAHNLQNRTAAVIENGSWAPQSGKLIREILSSMKNIDVLDRSVTFRSSLKPAQEQDLQQLADELCKTL